MESINLEQILSHTGEIFAFVGAAAGVFVARYLSYRKDEIEKAKRTFNLPEDSNPSYRKIKSISKAFDNNQRFSETGNKRYRVSIDPDLQQILERYNFGSDNFSMKSFCENLDRFYSDPDLKRYLLS
jgi:hypothetical protein